MKHCILHYLVKTILGSVSPAEHSTEQTASNHQLLHKSSKSTVCAEIIYSPWCQWHDALVMTNNAVMILFKSRLLTASYQLSPAFPREVRVVLWYRVLSIVSAASPAEHGQWPPRVPQGTDHCCLRQRTPTNVINNVHIWLSKRFNHWQVTPTLAVQTEWCITGCNDL